MLVLFDIDGTLLLTYGEGMRAMEDAGRELCRPDFTIAGADYSGRLDGLIWRQLCEMNELEPSEDLDARFRASYRRHLERRLANGASVDVLPGVSDLIDALRAVDRVRLGLVTGNFPETGRLKIEAAGLDFDVFTVFGWGSDGGHRRELPAVALSQHRAIVGNGFDPADAVIVGDTPHDIDCASHNGCRSIAVATGAFSEAELASHGADLVVADLTETDRLVQWVLREDTVAVR